MSASTLSYNDKLEALRKEMKRQGLKGFIIPHADEYQNEFVPPSAERLAWLTGFTGSAGVAVVLESCAGILTDGRYTVQLAQQADAGLYKLEDSTKISAAKFIADHAKPGDVIGYDPWLHTPRQIEDFENILSAHDMVLRVVDRNPLDVVWPDRPPAPMAAATIFPDDIAGRSFAEKREMIAATLKEKKIFAYVITAPDSLAWLLNVRGADVDYTPVVLSYGIVYAGEPRVKWFVDPRKISTAVRKHIGNDVEIVDPASLPEQIAILAAEAKQRPIALDFSSAPLWFKNQLNAQHAKIISFKDPCVLPRAMKTKSEQDSIRKVHIHDGAALVSFLAWLESEVSKARLTELDVVGKLEEFRRRNPDYKGPSFSTIAGFAGNGAIVHYRPSAQSNLPLKVPGVLLLDSGGQYAGGTTDITRTLAFGDVGEDFRRNFTLVLKAHIAVASAKFPAGTTGMQIDALARRPLWEQGLDYAHGTGHGVGCYLSVHEEAANLSPRGTATLHAGMLLSNEPGYYKAGAYGIRTENLVFVKEIGQAENGAKMLGFETVSLAPIQRSLIISSMLAAHEKEWINSYHLKVKQSLAPFLEPQALRWLESQTEAL